MNSTATADIFKEISIRGRMCFGIQSIENYISEHNMLSHFLLDILTVLKRFTSSNHLELWEDEIQEYNPLSIKIDKYDDDMQLSKEQYDLLKKFYENVNADFRELIYETIEIGCSNLYGGTGNYSSFSLLHTMNTFTIANKILAKVPNPISFNFSKFKEENGWGNTFIYEEAFR